MKRLLLIISACLISIGIGTAQNCDTVRRGNQTVIVKNLGDKGVSVDIFEGKGNNTIHIFNGTYGSGRSVERRFINSGINKIIFGEPKDCCHKKSKPYFYVGFGGFGFGPSTILDDAGDHLKGASSLRYTIGLIRQGVDYNHWNFTLGLNIEFNSLHLSGNYAFVESDNNTSSVQESKDGTNYSTSRLHITYLDIPFMIGYKPIRNLNISFGPQLKIRTASSSKVWVPNVSGHTKLGDNLGLRTVVPSLMFKVNYSMLGAYLSYDLTSAFKSDKGPKGNMLSAGITLGL